MTKEQIQAWGYDNHVNFHEQHLNGKLNLAARVGDVQDTGYSRWLGCTGWYIVVYVFLDDSERLTSTRVRTYGICAP